jgi:hypothetical protein
MRDTLVIDAERPLNLDHDRPYEGLEVHCVARLHGHGTWFLGAALSDRVECFGYSYPGSALTVTPGGLSARLAKLGTGLELQHLTTDSLGRAEFTLWFDGNDLTRLSQDGPWQIGISGNRVDSSGAIVRGTAVCVHAATQAWRREQFDIYYQGDLARYPRYVMEEFRSGEELVFTQGWDLLAAEVVHADTGGTRGHPPRITLRVDKVLKGRLDGPTCVAVWEPEPFDLPCLTGEEENLARRAKSPYPAPALGSRWVLGGVRGPNDSLWHCQELCRWPYSDSLVAYFRHRELVWKPRLAKFRRQQAALQLPALRAERIMQNRERARRSKQWSDARAWWNEMCRRSREADLASLARRADCIMVGRPRFGGFVPGSSYGRDRTFRVERRLRWPAQADTGGIQVIHITSREDSIGAQWGHAPSIRDEECEFSAIAFTRLVTRTDRDRALGALRLVDEDWSLVPADSNTLARLRQVLVRTPVTEWSEASSPGVSWRDFEAMSDADLCGAGIKLSPLYPPDPPSLNLRTLVLGCPRPGSEITGESFWSHLLPDSMYRLDSTRDAWHFDLRADELRVILDSLVALRPVRDSRVAVGDSVSLTLLRTVGGHTRQLECTLDSEAASRAVAIMLVASRPVPEPRRQAPTPVFEWNMSQWASTFVESRRRSGARH